MFNTYQYRYINGYPWISTKNSPSKTIHVFLWFQRLDGIIPQEPPLPGPSSKSPWRLRPALRGTPPRNLRRKPSDPPQKFWENRELGTKTFMSRMFDFWKMEIHPWSQKKNSNGFCGALGWLYSAKDLRSKGASSTRAFHHKSFLPYFPAKADVLWCFKFHHLFSL